MEKLDYVIKEFNKWHGSEAQAKILKVKEDEVIIEFKGTFCKTCGLYDYFDDIAWEAIDFGLKIKPVEIIESEEDFEEGRYVVRYKVERE
ncbi:hypothetical protein A3L04_07065 [Thermococcus chitonophagus]|uniref:Uncharacterized protein n=1 Tax=Thermococcus chitonophagus TaxID=54262 RepID=A0A160VT84_9EURY|nr:hypothetical protein [Thermococcus chitonophagus]ASJ16849.1 hypothetical protein A3L04_07065 [Thermococcus chitonophagus]CUX78327.1 hypothetical protein CHITON_1548 [Thermococcus chitonophagus]